VLISTGWVSFSFHQKTNNISNLGSSYTKILGLLHELGPQDNFLKQRRLPKPADKQLIALALAAESPGIDSERHLFKQLPAALTGQIDRSVFNRRRLAFKVELLRQRMGALLAPAEDYYVVDSMPLEICKFGRAKRLSICREAEASSPDYGYCAAHHAHYFGYKLHAARTSAGIIKTFDISKASTHDIHYLNDLKTQLHHCVLVGDLCPRGYKGYLSRQYQVDLSDAASIRLETPKRRNQLDFAPFNPVLRKARKRIETLFSQLCDQFMIRRNYAKSFQGLATRIVSKVAALTLVQWFNQLSGNPLNNLKIIVT
jgi:Transposase DDE domain